MDSTMQHRPLLLRELLQHGRTVFGDSVVTTLEPAGSRSATFAQVADRADQLAGALRRLGVKPDDRVGTLCWNTQEHLEAYLAVPAMGAVLHTLNHRLVPAQLAYCITHAADKVLLVDADLLAVLGNLRGQLPTVEHVIVVGGGPEAAADAGYDYERLLAAEPLGFVWPDLDERSAASMCYTSGTTGDPKGIVYSHRSQLLHTLAVRGELSITDADRLLAVVPMFHVNGWGLPYIGWYTGADLIMPARQLQAPRLCQTIEAERVTLSVGVPTVWSDVLRHADTNPVDFTSLRNIVVGGSAVPRTLLQGFHDRHHVTVTVTQAWGMTETSPIGAVAFPPKNVPAEQRLDWRTRTGRVLPGVELRVVDDAGEPLPADGATAGEIEVRGPWVTGSYYRDPALDSFHDGWLRTGDVGAVDSRGYVQITDRRKDVIKSGGEWISSVDLENELAGHPAVLEAVVIGIPDDRWEERPLGAIVVHPGRNVTVGELQQFLRGRVAAWWIPERWAFIHTVPRTSVGKFDKKQLRARHAAGDLEVTTSTP